MSDSSPTLPNQVLHLVWKSLRPNNLFKPIPLRYGKKTWQKKLAMFFTSTTLHGLTQALG